MYQYVLYSWFLANVMHPLCYLLMNLLREQSFNYQDLVFGIIYFIPLCLFSFFITLPSLLMGWLVMAMLTKIRCRVLQKFWMWLICIVPIILINLVCLMIVIKEPFSLAEVSELRIEQALILFPPIISAILASVFCFKRFETVFNQIETKSYETDLV